jgi:regulator of protease activity HflC (stomatin/prohibitin superfamily)
MIKIIAGGVAVFGVLLIGSCSFTKVSQGHVGVKVNNIGSGAGVSPKALGVGWYFTPPGVTIYEYPVFTNNYTWKRDDAAGVNEQFTFQDKNGLSIAADVSVAYRADPSKAPVLFQKYRVDMDGVLAGALRNTVRNAIVSNASTMSVEQIYGPQKAALIEKARKQASAYLEPYGLHVEQLYWASNIILPQNIQNQINARVANEQQALAEQAKVATATARANAAVAAAKGKAEALQIEQAAIQNSPQIIELRAVEKWNGVLPAYIASGSPIPMIGKAVN